MANFKDTFSKLLKARYPFIYIPTYEETRALELIESVATDAVLSKTARVVYKWSVSRGLLRDKGPQPPDDTKDPVKTLDFIEQCEEAAIFILKDFDVYFGSPGGPPGASRPGETLIIRKLRDLAVKLKANPAPQAVLFISPRMVLPCNLEKDITILDFDLPDFNEIKTLLQEMIQANAKAGKITISLQADDEERLAKAALGLTIQEAENAFSSAMVNDGRLDINDLDTILEEKCQIIKKSEILEFIKSEITMKDVGGLANLKRWLKKRDKSWLDEAQRYCLPQPKGVLITGVPGCGKSLTAKAMSSMWKLPLLRFDVGKVFGSLVGSSEENMRKALKTAEALAPDVLWIDEIEKGFSGFTSSGDSGTSSRVFGTFLTWMQEKTKPVFVIATANDIERLPPEFLRKGRFDEIFFVDLPTVVERKAIFWVHLRKRLKDPAVVGDFKIDEEAFTHLAGLTEGFSGAEIEQAIVNGLFDAFSESRAIRMDDFDKAITNTVPLSVTMAEQIHAIRDWAGKRAVAATPKEERLEYSQFSKKDDEGKHPGADVLSSRGGRSVDF